MDVEKLIVSAVVAILSFMIVNNYVKDFLIASKWSAETAAPVALTVSIILIGIIFGIVTIFLHGIFSHNHR
ncbi:MAG: hypothetical protein V1777_01270 [Candidatus Micrarchaeota archaeon]